MLGKMVKKWSLCMPARMLKQWSSPGCGGLACRMDAKKFCVRGPPDMFAKKLRARRWPPDMVATKVFPLPLCADWPVYLLLECVCLRGDTGKCRETPRGTQGHRETRRPQIHTETRRSFFFDKAEHDDHFLTHCEQKKPTAVIF